MMGNGTIVSSLVFDILVIQKKRYIKQARELLNNQIHNTGTQDRICLGLPSQADSEHRRRINEIMRHALAVLRTNNLQGMTSTLPAKTITKDPL
jgi:hypothetical protein